MTDQANGVNVAPTLEERKAWAEQDAEAARTRLHSTLQSMTSVYGSSMLAPIWDQLRDLDNATLQSARLGNTAVAELRHTRKERDQAVDDLSRLGEQSAVTATESEAELNHVKGYVDVLEGYIRDKAGSGAVTRLRRRHRTSPE